MPTHLANLSFDFDALSLWIARGMTTPTPISRGEFGAVAIPRILSLLEKYDIKASFFVPGITIETYRPRSRPSWRQGTRSATTAGPTCRPLS